VAFEVFTAVRMMMFFFWVLAPCKLVGRCQRFGETYSLHRQDFDIAEMKWLKRIDNHYITRKWFILHVVLLGVWACVFRMGGTRNPYKISVGKPNSNGRTILEVDQKQKNVMK
jgi:hypothetical protein